MNAEDTMKDVIAWRAADAPRSVGQQRMLVVDPLAGVSFDTEARRLPELLHPGDLVVVNDATEAGAGFGVDTNRVTIVGADGREERIPLMAKGEVADVILDRVEALLRGR